MGDFWKRNAPPGINLKQMYYVFLLGNLASAFVSMVDFTADYLRARNELFIYRLATEELTLIEGAVIAPFHAFVDSCFLGFALTAVCLLAFAIYHWAYYRQGSMSIYLMKRLPDRGVLYKQVLTVPCLAALATAAVAAVTVLLCFCIYLLATPGVCLPY